MYRDRYLEQQQAEARQAREQKKQQLFNTVKTANAYRNKIGNIGKQLSGFENQKIANLGNNLYKYSGNQGIDALKGNINNRISQIGAQQSTTPLAQTGTQTLGQAGQTGTLSQIGNTLSTTGLSAGESAGGTVGNMALQNAATGNALAGAGSGALAGAESGALGAGAGVSTLGAGAGLGATSAGTGAAAAGTAGTAGATAAGTAGTAAAGGAATAAGAAIPIVGWVALAAKLAYDQYNAHKKRQQARAMQADDSIMQAVDEQGMQAEKQDIEDAQNIAKLPTATAQTLETVNNQQPDAEAERDAFLGRFEGENPLQTNENTQSAEELSSAIYNQYSGGDTGNYEDAINNAVMNNQESETPSLVKAAAAQELLSNPEVSGESEVPPPANIQPEQAQAPQSNKSSIINDLMSGYQENATHRLGDTRQTIPNENKTWATRAGEGLGTVSRIAQNPLVQGLVAGGLDYAVNRDAGSALKTGASYMSDKAKTNSYRDMLQQGDNPIYYNPGILGTMSSSDYRQMAQQPMQDAMTQKYQEEAYKKQIENQQLDLLIQSNPKLTEAFAKIVTSPRRAQEIAKEYNLNDNEMAVLNAKLANSSEWGAINKANQNTNAYSKNELEKRKQEYKENHPEYFVKGYGRSGGYSRGGGYTKSGGGGGSSYIPNTAENYPDYFITDKASGKKFDTRKLSYQDFKKIQKSNEMIDSKSNSKPQAKPQATPQTAGKRIREMIVNGDFEGAYKKWRNPAGLNL